MESLSLKELKAENAEVVEETEVVAEVVAEPEVTDDEMASEPEAEQAEEVESTEEDKPEAWMQPEEAEDSEDDQKGGFVPNHAVAAVRRKLKGKLSVVKDENEALKERIEALENGTAQAPTPTQVAPRPKRDDFDFDDDAYDAAVDKWNDDKLEARFASHNANTQQQAQASQAETSLKSAIDGHYDRASKLVDSGKVSEDAYHGADTLVRQTMENLSPGRGAAIVDSLINTLSITGDDSEKVIYQLGVNPSKLSALANHMRNDPSGLSAAAYLGKLQSGITSPQKRKSTTPKPAALVNGDSVIKGPGDSARKKYLATDSAQTRWDIKKAAKAKGVDTSQW